MGNYQKFYMCAVLLSLLVCSVSLSLRAQEYHAFDLNADGAIRSFFTYTHDRIPFVGAHRGGTFDGFPENTIATFDHVLALTHALIEVDPRLTRDSVVVLMHDETLERTTTGRGLVSDHTWEELKRLRLKDAAGNVTNHRIPTLADVLRWARGKTILMLDKKDVPMSLLLEHISEAKAESYVLVSTYTPGEAVYYHQRNKEIMFEAFILNMETLQAYEAAGIPWENVVAYVSKSEDTALYDALHEREVMCIFYTARGIERLADRGQRIEAYRRAVNRGADIILCDNVSEVVAAIGSLQPTVSKKRKFFVRKTF